MSMPRWICKLVLMVLLVPGLFGMVAAQQRDTSASKPADSASIRPVDTVKQIRSDSAMVAPPAPAKPKDTTLNYFNQLHPDLPVNGSFFFRMEEEFQPRSSDFVFYLVAGMLLVLGIMRIAFSKYYSDLLRIFGQTTFKQKSIRDQLLQNRLASLLLNFFFCVSAGTFLYFLAKYRHWLPQGGLWWQQLLICVGFIAGIYLVKYIGMQISGWLFGLKELADTYTFMVFLVNKVVGIMLLPATVALALGAPDLQAVCMVASLAGLSILYLYRYIIALPMLRQHVKIVPLHFFLYLCAFEIIPVLVVYKILLTIINS